MLEIPRLDIKQRINDTFQVLFTFRMDDGALRSFAGKTAVFHAQSGADTLHYASPSSQVAIVDVPDGPKGPGGPSCGIRVTLSHTITETWDDQDKWLYSAAEWSDVSGIERYTLIDGVITAELGVVDGSD